MRRGDGVHAGVVRVVLGVPGGQVQGLEERIAVPAVRGGHVQQRCRLQVSRRLPVLSRQGHHQRAERPGQSSGLRLRAVLPNWFL